MAGGRGNRDDGGNLVGNRATATEECCYCRKLGHWTREHLKKAREEDAPDSGLPMTAVEENAALTTNLAATTAKLGARHPYCPLTKTLPWQQIRLPRQKFRRAKTLPWDASTTLGTCVYLNEERARVKFHRAEEESDEAWFLDNGSSNNMTEDSSAFSELDKYISGAVKFGDGSLVDTLIHTTGARSCSP
jgi:hypothetical protein